MIVNTLGARVGAKASARGRNSRLPTLGDIVRILLAIVSLGAAVALFFGWLMFSDSSRPTVSGFDSQWDCTSLGRAGERCVKRPAGEGQSNLRLAGDGDCPSLGRAGRICVDHPRE